MVSGWENKMVESSDRFIKLDIGILLSKVLQIPSERITLETNTITCSEWDSITHNVLITEIESKCGVFISPETVSDLLSVKKIIQMLTTTAGFVQDNSNPLLLWKDERERFGKGGNTG